MSSDTAPATARPSPNSSCAQTETWPKQPPEFVALADAWEPSADSTRLSGIERRIESGNAGALLDTLTRCAVAVGRHDSPNLLEQLRQSLRRPVDTVLCSTIDPDCTTSLHSALAARFPVELVAGVVTIARATNATPGMILIDAQMPTRWLAPLRRAAAGQPVRIDAINNDYPQADPTLLAYTLRSRKLRPGRLPTDAGVILIDGAAAVAVGRALLSDEPMRQVPVAVRDHGLSRTHYCIAPIGRTIDTICEQLDVTLEGRVIRVGALLRDIRVAADYVLGAGELLVHTTVPGPAVNPSPCVRCGWCVEACPTGVHPATALEASQRNDVAMAQYAGVEGCLECGLCSYVCPSHLPLLTGIRLVRDLVRAQAAPEGQLQ